MVASRHVRLQDLEQAMKPLSVTLVLFGVLALVQPARQLDLPGALLGIVVLLCAATTFRSTAISSFLKIFVGIFSTETIVFGLAVLAGRAGLWPADYAEYLPPESLPLTVAIFSILVYLVAQSGMVRQIMRIADRYFNAEEAGASARLALPSFYGTRAADRCGDGRFPRADQSGSSRHHCAAELLQPRPVQCHSKP